MFKSANRYVLIDAEEVLDELFIVDEEYPLVRLCINALKHLDNQQLAFVLHYIDLLQEMTYLESEISEDEYEETLQTILLEKFGEDCYDAVLTLIESYKP